VSLSVSDVARSVAVMNVFMKNLNYLKYGSSFIVCINGVTMNKTANRAVYFVRKYKKIHRL
jgi:hypothetical protein